MFSCPYKELLKMKPFEARSKIIEVYLEVRSIRKTAELLEISRNTVRKWVRRFKKKGGEGLYPMSKRPKRSPNKTPDDIEDNVVKLRRETGFGAKKLSIELKRRYGIELSEHTIRHILDRHNLTKKKPKMRVYPTHWAWEDRDDVILIQMDTKDVIDKKTLGTKRWDYYRKSGFPRYQWTALEGRSRLRIIGYSKRLSVTNGIGFMILVVTLFRLNGIKGRIEIQTDWGGEFGGDSVKRIAEINERYLNPLGAKLVRIPKGRKTYNGRVERSHRTDDEEFYIPSVLEISGIEEFYEKAKRWIDYYNMERPHLGIDGETPMRRFEKLYGRKFHEALIYNAIDIGEISTDLILLLNQKVGHNVPAQYSVEGGSKKSQRRFRLVVTLPDNLDARG